jgi:hypothetical protein
MYLRNRSCQRTSQTIHDEIFEELRATPGIDTRNQLVTCEKSEGARFMSQHWIKDMFGNVGFLEDQRSSFGALNIVDFACETYGYIS